MNATWRQFIGTPDTTFKSEKSGQRLQRATEGQIQPHPSDSFVLPVLQFRNAVVAKPRGTAPDGDIAVTQGIFSDGVVPLQASELEGRGKTQ
jgi:hypothetical protein